MTKEYLAIRKGDRAVVYVQRTTYRDRQQIDLRTFFFVSEAQPRQPTQKGVTFQIADLPRLRAALQRAEMDAIADGSLDPAMYEAAGIPFPDVAAEWVAR
jgi:hypothetical protein